jgi:hypothetical protein
MPMWISCTVKNASALHTRRSQAGRQVQRAADAAALHGGDDREARLFEHIETRINWRSEVLKGQPRACVAGVSPGRPDAKHLQCHAGAEVLAGGRDDQRTRLAGGVERLHGVAQRRKEGRRPWC